MKKQLSLILFRIIIVSMFTGNAYSQANTNLSNLVSPISINQHLLPNADNVLDLGSATRSWRFVYLDSQVYLKNILAIHARGIGNFFTGLSAGNNTLTGTYNSGFGQFALSRLTSGIRNSAMGYGTLASTTMGSFNVANGSNALFANTTGTSNTANGYATLIANTTGSYNTANGARVLNSNTTGNS